MEELFKFIYPVPENLCTLFPETRILNIESGIRGDFPGGFSSGIKQKIFVYTGERLPFFFETGKKRKRKKLSESVGEIIKG